ncbi:hypothetical protein B0T18DRAFT_103016 [Schizothecium vesticola]|uniref:Uncharacterized protein n=1 Tax=Schizothecium vesticola TaxID=314040 RepID=A0AA40F193_9PEZI|nr:hypothetical protein B0T18DRAFT_103016 [Schizothecium vesticola]
MAWGLWPAGQLPAPQSPENTRRRPLAHNQHHRSLRRRRASTPRAPDQRQPHRLPSEPLREIPVSLVGYYPTCGRSTWRRPSAVRLGRRMREGCIPALGMGVDRRAFSTFLVRLRGLWAREIMPRCQRSTVPLCFPASSFGRYKARQRRHGGTKSTKTPSAQLTPDADELAHSPPMPVTGRQRGCQSILAAVRQVRLAGALPTRCAGDMDSHSHPQPWTSFMSGL